VRLALDDFGTGFSSLTYLRLFPFDVLKIDRSFTADMVDDGSRSSAIVASVLHLARDLGIAVVAEGVETEDHLRKVADLRCDYAQGYHLGRPVPAAAFEDLLATSPRPIRLPSATAGRTPGVGLP
jgi:EAL domain-containing protein (putative c-di-GMP-specific phosphodiesterase class I)